MQPIQRAILAARRRIFLQRWLSVQGWVLLAGAGLVAVLLLGERLFAMPMGLVGYLAIGVAALLIAPLLAMRQMPQRETIAEMVDERLGLKDRLGTALYLQNVESNPFAKHVLAEAEAWAKDARVAPAFPIRFTRAWGWVPPTLAILAVLAVFLEPMDLMGIAAARQARQKQQAKAEQDREELEKAVQAVSLSQQKDPAKAAEDMEAMKQLMSMSKRDLSNPEMREQATAKLSEIEDRVAQEVEQKKQETQDMDAAMSQLDPEVSGPANEMADAMRRGDYDAAQKAMEKLTKAVKSMSDAEKQALAKQLQNMANQMQQSSQQFGNQQAQAQKNQQQTQQQMQQQMQQQGQMTPKQAQQAAQQIAQQMQQNPNMTPQQMQQAMQQAMQQQGMKQQQAQQMSQQMQQQMKQMQQQLQQAKKAGNCKKCAGGMAQGMQKMAQGASGKNGQGMQQGASQAGGMMQQMARMKESLRQQQSAQQQLQQAMRQMGASQQNKNFSPPNQSVSQKGGGVGPGTGRGDGGNPFGAQRQHSKFQSEAKGDIGQGQGKVIASWLEKGQAAKGAATVEFDKAVTEARGEAEKAVTDDRVPRQYHNAIRKYFDQLPQSPDEVGAAPAGG